MQQLLRSAPWWSHLALHLSFLTGLRKSCSLPLETPPYFLTLHRSPKSEVLEVKLEVCHVCFLHIKIACHLAARVTVLSFQIDNPTKNQYINHRSRPLLEAQKRNKPWEDDLCKKITPSVIASHSGRRVSPQKKSGKKKKQ